MSDFPRRGEIWTDDRLGTLRHRVDVQALTDVNNMLFKILATPDRS